MVFFNVDKAMVVVRVGGKGDEQDRRQLERGWNAERARVSP